MTTPTISVWDAATSQWVYVASGPSPGSGGGEGGAPTRYVHIQAVLASTWTITHNLGAHPSVAVEDAVGTVLYGTISYQSDNALTVSFNRTCTGRANLI